uniref:Sex determination protein tasselseed-2 n=1 Tax=Aegilops tauschii TaxID=37682 RepID=R7WC11_AEGTA
MGLTKNKNAELGEHGIRVNCVSPFGVATPMLVNAWRHGEDDQGGAPAPAPVRAEEVEKAEEMVRGLATLKGPTLRAGDIAEAALFLASDESGLTQVVACREANTRHRDVAPGRRMARRSGPDSQERHGNGTLGCAAFGFQF